MAVSRSRPTGAWTAVAAAVGILVLIDVLRVWLPSVIFIFGRAGSTPATELGAFAVLWFLLGLLGAGFVRRAGAPRMLLVAAGLLAAARLVLQVTSGGGSLQLYAASAALLGGILWLAALAAGTAAPRDLGLGLAAGVAASVTLHAALETVDLTWRDDGAGDLAPVAALVALLALFLLASARAVRNGEVAADGRGPAWPWLAIGPAVLLVGVLSGVTGRTEIAVGVGPTAAAALLAAAHGAGIAAAVAAQRSGRAAGPVVAVAVLAGTGLAIPAAGPWGPAGQIVLAVAVGGMLGLAGAVRGSSSSTARAVAAAAGMLLFFLFGFLYYAAYDLVLGFDNRLVLVAAALVGAGLALRMRPPRMATAGPVGGWGFAAVVAAAAVLAGLGMGATPGEPAADGDGWPVRVMTYNIHMGFDTAGRFDTDALLEAVQAVDPDVLVLNEVDRGWMLNGGHDTLDLLSRGLDMPYRFGPAADRVWGNAVLSRLPMSEATVTPLPREDTAMRRSAISVVVQLGGGRELGVVGTHLHHRDDGPEVRLLQAEVVAVTASQLRDPDRPVAVLGDMNAEPTDPELEPLMENLTDVLAAARPVRTFPSWDPTEEIDHIFVTPELTGDRITSPHTEASDHLGVGVTLSPAGS